MSLNPILLIVWAVLAIAFLGLLMYRGQLTRYEEDQLFISSGATQQAIEEQNNILTRVHKLTPILSVVGVAAAAMTVFVVGSYVWQAYLRIR